MVRFLEVEYTGYLENGEVFDSTDPQLVEGATGPVVIVPGEGHLLEGLEKELEGMKPGEEREVELAPADAFGERDAKKIKLYPLRAFARDQIRPYPGLRVTVDGKLATIKSVSPGRVVVDFNHPLAGHRLRYRLRLIRELSDRKEQLEGLLKFHFGEPKEFEIEGDTLRVRGVPDYFRARLEKELLKFFPFKKVEFTSDGDYRQM